MAIINNILYGSLEERKSCFQVYLRLYGENRIETLPKMKNKLYIHPQKLPEVYDWKKGPINVNLTWMWDRQLKIIYDLRLSFHPILVAVQSSEREQGKAAAIFCSYGCLILPSRLPGNLHNLLAVIDPK